MVKIPKNTTVNTYEFVPDEHSIAFAPELIQFIKDNQKLTTYRFGRKYDHFKIGELIDYLNSETDEVVGKLRITDKKGASFADLPLDTAMQVTFRDKEHQRQVLSGYYAYIGRDIADDDFFLIFDFSLVTE